MSVPTRQRAVLQKDVPFVQTSLLPIVVVLVVIAFTATFADALLDMTASDAKLVDVQPLPSGFPANTQLTRQMIAAAILLYSVLLHGSRCAKLGIHYSCEILWGCNFSLVLAGVGLGYNVPVLVGAATCIVAVDQLCWYLDCAVFMLTGNFPIGVAAYIVHPSTPYLHKVTSVHHLWFLPVCMYALQTTGMPSGSYTCSIVLTSILAVSARILTPHAVDEGSSIQVLNINLCYAFLDDINIPVLHILDYRHPLLYLPYLIFVSNIFLNSLPVAIIYGIANMLHSRSLQ